MTNKLEKQFFDTFGIKEKELEYPDNFTYYPEITDHILLGLFCIANEREYYSETTNMKNIKERTLRMLLRTEKFYKNYYSSDRQYKKLVKRVRTLFEENK